MYKGAFEKHWLLGHKILSSGEKKYVNITEKGSLFSMGKATKFQANELCHAGNLTKELLQVITVQALQILKPLPSSSFLTMS